MNEPTTYYSVVNKSEQPIPDYLTFLNPEQAQFQEAMINLETAMEQDIENIYEESDPEGYLETTPDEDLWAESIIAIGLLALLYKKQIETGLKTINNSYKTGSHKAFIEASQAGIAISVNKYKKALISNLPTRAKLKSFNSQLTAVGLSVVQRGKMMVATAAGLSKGAFRQVKTNVLKKFKDGLDYSAALAEATRQKKNQLNKRIRVTASLVTKRAKEVAKRVGVKTLATLGQLPEGQLWAEWVSKLDDVTTKNCRENNGHHRKVGNAFPDGATEPPSLHPHKCRSQLRYYIIESDGTHTDVKGINRITTTFL